jgi:hypothetical protein
MVQPQHGSELGVSHSAGEDRLARVIREHIAKGNRPDYALAQEKARRLNELAATHEKLGLSEDEIDALADEICSHR